MGKKKNYFESYDNGTNVVIQDDMLLNIPC